VTFDETALPGAFVIELERHSDERGFFARTFAIDEFANAGLATELIQTSIAWNATAGTIRGLHFQYPPDAEAKIVRCTRGAVHDVIVDLRPESPTYLRWVAVRLDDSERRALYVPERFAHGYQTLVDDCEVSYAMTCAYAPHAAGGLPVDDPELAISWPLPIGAISQRDRDWPPLSDLRKRLIAAMSG
jgi:dTDP-4-dehydrorhamnose 3,5-epimerase